MSIFSSFAHWLPGEINSKRVVMDGDLAYEFGESEIVVLKEGKTSPGSSGTYLAPASAIGPWSDSACYVLHAFLSGQDESK
jgi:hypothetical protein